MVGYLWEWEELDWKDPKKELPSSHIEVFVKNGKKVYWAKYIKGKWKSLKDCEEIQLHKVTKWAQHPHIGLKIPSKDFDDYMNRAKKYRKQMQKREFN